MELPILQLRPPFAGTRTSAASRSLGPNEAHDSLNVWTSDGDIRVRPPVNSTLTAFSFPSGRFPALMIRAVPIFAGDRFWLLTVHVLDNLSTYVQILDVDSGLANITHTMTYQHMAGWRVGISQVAGTVFVICGVATNAVKFWWTGTAWSSDIIGAGLHGAATVAAAAGGALTADTTYSYRCTYYSSVTGTESAPGTAASATTTSVNKTINLTGLVASSDLAIDTRRIYRQQNLIDDTWYLLATQADTVTSYSDAGAVTPTKSIDNRMPLFAFDVTDNIANCAMFKRRMWYALDGQPGVYVHSELDTPESINPLNTYSAAEDDGDPVMWMGAVDEALYCLRLRSIDIITGDSPESFVCSRLSVGPACISQSSVVVVGSKIYFMSIQGLYVIDGGQVATIPISDPIRDQLRVGGAMGLTVGAVNTDAGLIFMSTPTTGGEISQSVPPVPLNSTPFTQYVYDYWRDRWFIWNMHARGIGVMQRNYHFAKPMVVVTEIRPPPASASIEFKIGLLNYDGVLPSNGMDFEAYPIEWTWETGDFDLNTAKEKHFYYATVLWQADPLSGDAPIQLRWYRNQSGIPLGSMEWPANLDGSNGSVKMGFAGNTTRFKLSGQANHQLRIVGIDFEAEPKGAR